MTRELSLTRPIAAPRERLYRAWTQPDLLQPWFTPRPWTTPVVELDVLPASDRGVRRRLGPRRQ